MVGNGTSKTEALAACFKNASADAREFAEEANSSTADINQYEAKQYKAQVALQAQNKTFANTKKIITEYNALMADAAHANEDSDHAATKSRLSQEQFIESVEKSNPGLAKYLKGLKDANGSVKGYIGSLVKATAKTIGATIATAALNAALTLGFSLVMSLLSTALQPAIEAIKKALTDPKELIEDLDKELASLQSTMQSTANEFSSLKQKSNEVIPRFAELCKGVDEYGNRLTDANGKMILTEDEYEEFWKLNNQIAEMFPDLDLGIDKNGNHILKLSYTIDALFLLTPLREGRPLDLK